MNWKTIWQSFRQEEMRNRIGFIVLLIVIYRALSHIPVPIADNESLKGLLDGALNSDGIAGFFNLFSGGALANFSIVIVGLGPYITASIIFQLLTKVVPRLEDISKDGESGRRKINQYTRYLTAPLAIVQAIAVTFIIRSQASSLTGTDIGASMGTFDWVLVVAALVGGAMLLMWLGELMTEQGVGNGISILIFAGIISQLPQVLSTLLNTVVSSFESGSSSSVFGLFDVPFNLTLVLILAAFLVAFFLVTFWVVKLNEAQRLITVSYAKRVQGNRAYGGVDTVLPVKLIVAGVIPVIFAFAFILIPAFLGTFMADMDNATLANIGQLLDSVFGGVLSGNHSDQGIWSLVGYTGFLFALVVGFTYFYTSFVFNPKEISENLQAQGGFIAGIRPGQQTEDYLKGIVNRLNLFGAGSLGLLSILPFIVQYFLNTTTLTLGGTGLLITVSVAIETLRQVESKAMMVTYDQPTETKK